MARPTCTTGPSEKPSSRPRTTRSDPGPELIKLHCIMTKSDLHAYQAGSARRQRPYRGLDIYGMAPPSSSGSTVGEALNILSG